MDAASREDMTERHIGISVPESLTASRSGNVAILRLARPMKRNALNDEMILGIEQFFLSLPADIGAAVIASAGDDFSAGLDLSEIVERNTIDGVAHSMMWHRVFERIEFGKVPVVAVLKGAVVGGGLELACAAHIRVAERSAYYALPEGQRGIFVGGGASVRIPRLIGTSKMADMMLTGRVFDAEAGQNLGLSHYLVALQAGLATGISIARRIAQNAQITNFAVLHVLPRIADADWSHGLLTESLIAAIAQGGDDAKLRLQAFLEKRAKKVTEF